mmetsp:Transcript_3996/g.6089  ORF Transcript_3996/g.6089 Transcript_3996/m.6089 type:complete len:231 (-) Transcript_3996:64-756(-)
MHIIPLSSVKKSFTSAPCISSRCHQDSIFQQCHHAHHLAVSIRHLPTVLICPSSPVLCTVSFISATKSSRCKLVQHLSSVLPCTSSRCPENRIFSQCDNAHHLVASLQHLPKYYHARHFAVLRTPRFQSAKYIISLSSLQHLSKVISCTSSRCPQYSIFSQCYHAHHLAVLSTTSFSSATMHIISLFQYGITVLPRTSSRCLSTAIFHQCNHAHHLTVSVRHLSAVQPCT